MIQTPNETRKAQIARTSICPGCGGPKRASSYRCAECRRKAETRRTRAVMEGREQARQQGHDLSGYRCRLCGMILAEASGTACPVTRLEQGRRERTARGGAEG